MKGTLERVLQEQVAARDEREAARRERAELREEVKAGNVKQELLFTFLRRIADDKEKVPIEEVAKFVEYWPGMSSLCMDLRLIGP